MTADMIITGKIITGLFHEKPATMMAVKNGIICYVGDKEKIQDFLDKDTKLVELEDECVMPGIFDGHAHATSGVPIFGGVNLYGLETIAEYMDAIGQYIEKNPEKNYIIGRGYINSHFGPQGPTAVLLDEKYAEKCFYLESEDCHSCWVNQNVLELAGIHKNTIDLENGVIVRNKKTGEPTGWLKETEMFRAKKVFPRTTVEDYKKTILEFQKISVSKGITAIYEPILDDQGDLEKRIEAYYQLDLENLLTMDFRIGITVNPEQGTSVMEKIACLQKEKKGKHFQLLGIKVFIDGVVEGHTAFLREEYADKEGDCGENMWKQETLNHVMIQAAFLKLPVHVHTIGDAALDSALVAFEASWDICKTRDYRNCITHLQIVHEDQIRRMEKLKLIAVTNPFWHIRKPAYFQDLEIPFLGQERAENQYPMKSFVDNHVVLTQASDWPVTSDHNPFIGMEIAVTRRENGDTQMLPLNEKEAVSVEEMICALTINGAYQLHLEKELGTLEPGKRANFIILDQDPRGVKPDKLAGIKVLQNYFNGINVIKT